MIVIADSGATKTSWVAQNKGQNTRLSTEGISPYFFSSEQIAALVQDKLLNSLPSEPIEAIYYYGTGCATETNKLLVKNGLANGFKIDAPIEVESDLMAAARALCGAHPGVACILGTGSNSCVFDGRKIIRNNPAPGFILGDEGSGAYLGKKVLQYFIYETFDEELMHKFRLTYTDDYRTILDKVYKQAWPNRYLASFAPFLSENRGHYMIENIIEDGLSDFFQHHLYKYPETWQQPIHFVGSIAFHFADMVKTICQNIELECGNILKEPMEGLITFHLNNN